MGSLSLFLKSNKKEKSVTEYAATKSLCDEDGNPVKWTIRPISTKENDAIRDECTIDVQVTGKSNVYRPKLVTSKYVAKLICATVIMPDLNDKDLQDSYGVMSAEELLREMVDDPGEYSEFARFVQNFNGFNETVSDKVNDAKN